MSKLKITIIGAGSRSFGACSVRDVFLSDTLAAHDVELVLMDKLEAPVTTMEKYAQHVKKQLGRTTQIVATTDLQKAVDGADFVVTAVEAKRWLYWAMDFHIPRKYGIRQVFGENGGPGGMFHALRNFVPMIEIARAMERLCPDAWLLNFSNPEHKVCEAVSRLTKIKNVGLCHGVYMGLDQMAHILGMKRDDLDAVACGINHFTFFQYVRDRRTGEDLYPRLRQADRAGDPVADWHELGLGRILFRRFGLWPSPGANHYGEYIRWADEFVAGEMQFYYDPADGPPWQTGKVPEWLYTINGDFSKRPFQRAEEPLAALEDSELKPSGEIEVAIAEAIGCGEPRFLDAINITNNGAIPNLPDDMVVEVPADADASGMRPRTMEPLPEAVAAMMRTQGSIHKLLVEAYAEQSRDKLLQALLLDPCVDSYRRAVECMDEMLAVESELLPPIK